MFSFSARYLFKQILANHQRAEFVTQENPLLFTL